MMTSFSGACVAWRALAIGMMVSALGTRPTLAQGGSAPRALVTGIVYDSIANRAIAGATVEFVNANDPAARPSTTMSDGEGRYTLRDIPRGTYLAGFFHPALDTLGLEAAPKRVQVNARRSASISRRHPR